MGVAAAGKSGIILTREREKEMKMPKESTIRNRIHWYAEKVGFTIHRLMNGNYNVYDTTMKYIVHNNVNMDTVVRVVTDEMYMIGNNPR